MHTCVSVYSVLRIKALVDDHQRPDFAITLTLDSAEGIQRGKRIEDRKTARTSQRRNKRWTDTHTHQSNSQK